MLPKCVFKHFNSFYFKSYSLNFATKAATSTLQKTLKTVSKNVKQDGTNIPDYVTKYFASKKELELIQKFPGKLLRKKPTPKNLYVAHYEAAAIIGKHLKNVLNKNDTLLEVNPGTGILTNEIIKSNASKIILIESLDEFVKKLQLQYEKNERIKIKNGDVVNLWKLAFRDKIDQGKRVEDLLSDVPKKEFNDDPNMKLFACVGTVNFFKHLINALVFGRSLYSYGRCEMFLIVTPPVYIHLTCNNDIGYMLYRSTSILFQIMFEYQFITKLPRKYFLPWSYDYDFSANKKLTKVKSIDPEYVYLVRIVPRRNLYDLCSAENMQPLWYFVKQNYVSRKTRIIPTLEKWIPGCGPRLIINTNKGEKVKLLFPDDNINALPKYSKPCLAMSKQDYYPSIDIFSEFGDLTPSQMFTLFCLFRNWPEYEESSFLASLENSLLKIETSNMENVDGIEMPEALDDDTTPSTSEAESRK